MEEMCLSRGTEAGKGKQERRESFSSCEAPGGGKKRNMRKREFVANNIVARFGKLAKSRAIDGCTPAPFFRWYNVSRGT